MSGTNIQKALLTKGYFPRELPPTFTTADFGLHSPDILNEWESRKVFSKKAMGKTPCKKKRSNAYSYSLKSAEAEVISKPKRGYERRNIHLTHPVAQALIAAELSNNWRPVQKWLSRQEFSEDDIRVSEKYERSIKGINFAMHRAKKS
ncbi:hypothetical protein [Aminobacter carboxidus]|uniref:hypothetical protein n=1 Tax=Aminobacter carboxidus TaxID=376165 RepID=UPI001AEF07EE|nr:hypothetical protein [Aminobacter carboxidus]